MRYMNRTQAKSVFVPEGTFNQQHVVVMKQTKIQSLIETIVNIGIGYCISVVINMLVLPMFGYYPNIAESAEIALIFTIVSIGRSYFIRRFFNWFHALQAGL